MRRQSAHSGLPGAFLIEIVIVILFFALSAGTILTLFGYAEKTSRKAEDLTSAMILAQSLAETLRTAEDMEEALLAEYPEMLRDGEDYVQPLDDEMLPASEGALWLCVHITREETAAGILSKAEIAIETALGEGLYTLTAAGYLPLEVLP